MRLLRTEGADAVQSQGKFGAIDPVEPVDDLVRRPAIHVADEAQCNVVILHIDPARSGEATAKQ